MFYLFLAMLCSATIAMIFKYTEDKDSNRYLITSSNYFIAFSISLFMVFYKKILIGLVKEQSFYSELRLLLSGFPYTFTAYGSVLWGLLIGGISGLFFLLSFIYYQKSVRENGVGISGTFAKLGILIPMIFSIVLWKEFPSTFQWIGIVLSLVSILIVNISPKNFEKFDIKPTIILLFIFGGMAEFSNKIYQQYALNQYKDIFLFAIFFVAFIISMFFTLKDTSKINKRDILTGLVVGIPNLFSSFFLILSLDTLKASVAFPIYSAGSIVLINMGGLLIFKEKISNKNKVAIGLIIIGLILINI